MTRIGSPGTALTEKMLSPIIVKNSSGNQVTHHYDVNEDSAETALAGYNWGDAHAAPYEDALLAGIQINKSTGDINAIVDIVYETPDFSYELNKAAGTVTQSGDSNVQSIPLEQHPNWTDTLKAKRIEGGTLEGVTSFYSPQPVYTREEVLSSFTWTEAGLIGAVGKTATAATMAAKGLAAATENYWLQTQLALRQVGTTVVKTEKWQYAGPPLEGWDTDIYTAS